MVISLASRPTQIVRSVPSLTNSLLLRKIERGIRDVDKLACRNRVAIELNNSGAVDLEVMVENVFGTVLEGIEVAESRVSILAPWIAGGGERKRTNKRVE
jgi:hypothetical protein